eukprot:m.121179 g.121179  ORF g.121179 m.121179 type:complete len:411 (+) comp14383_c0_seq3:61-1293(+)
MHTIKVLSFLLLLAARQVHSSSDLQLKLLSDAKSTGAVCLDGTSPGYYYRKGSETTKFLLIFNGGGWCRTSESDDIEKETLLECSERASGSLGSSKSWAQTIHDDGVTNSNCTFNPTFCNWNIMYMYYCDGASFSGDLDSPVEVPGGRVSPIFFRGKRILDANIQDMLSTMGLSRATEVVLSGHSAGGLATYLHADYVQTLLPASVTKFHAIPDAGFFLDHVDVNGTNTFGRGMRALFQIANASHSLNKGCIARSNDMFDCVFPQNFADLIRSPMHPIQSLYDTYQLRSILYLPKTCEPVKPGSCTTEQLEMFQEYHVAQRNALNMTGLYNKSGNGIWNDACMAHSQGYYGSYYNNVEWEVPANSGMTLAKSIFCFLNGCDSVPSNFHHDIVEWPNNGPCSKADLRHIGF